MRYGKNVGRKFYEDGRARRFPGNTVVADVTPDCSAFDTMVRLRRMVIGAGLDGHFILLPPDSYHMTVLRGVNDQVRDAAHWPKDLPADAPMTKVDDHVSAAVGSVPLPEGVRMRFDRILWGDSDMRVLLVPADEEQNRILREFRDRAATAIGLFLPQHKDYRFHITLAYVRVVPEGEELARTEAMVKEMDRLLAVEADFEITKPYMAFFDDMLAFSPERLPRD